ncbi:MAG: hypothetical protein LJE87_09490 [Deltaproteobacteria bacterium]|nr:hypothetical protein [Deltaproteobacteria bacterium]
MFNIKSKTLQLVVISQLTVLFLFIAMTTCNEIFDLPHILFGDKPTSLEQRIGEVIIEFAILTIIMIIEIILIKKLYQRIRILEGFLPICANCKKIRHGESWDQIEKYISDHSLAKFSHSICPDCKKKLYPEFCHEKIE